MTAVMMTMILTVMIFFIFLSQETVSTTTAVLAFVPPKPIIRQRKLPLQHTPLLSLSSSPVPQLQQQHHFSSKVFRSVIDHRSRNGRPNTSCRHDGRFIRIHMADNNNNNNENDMDDALSKLIGKRNQIKRQSSSTTSSTNATSRIQQQQQELLEEQISKNLNNVESMIDFDLDQLPEFQTPRIQRRSWWIPCQPLIRAVLTAQTARSQSV